MEALQILRNVQNYQTITSLSRDETRDEEFNDVDVNCFTFFIYIKS